MGQTNNYLKYNDPLLITFRKGTPDDPFVERTDTNLKIIQNRVVLSEIPSELDHVQIEGYVEIYKGEPNDIQFIVNYQTGEIFFNPSQEGLSVSPSYKSRGVIRYPAERIYCHSDDPDIVTTLQGVVDETTSIINTSDRFTHLGEYNSDTTYYQRNIVSYNGSSYMCINDGVSGILPTDTTNWKLIAQKGDRGERGIQGIKGDTGEAGYTPVKGVDYFDGEKGEKGLNWKGEYNSQIQYVVDDAVQYNGSSYICILDSLGNFPTNTTYWSLLASKGEQGIQGIQGEPGKDGYTPIKGIDYFDGEKGEKGDRGLNWRGDYVSTTQYMVDDAVQYNGSSYICILDNIGVLPINQTYWDLLAQKGQDSTGDMSKSIYDIDNNGIVDNAEAVNGYTVETNVPSNAQFTDTITTINGKTGAISKEDIVALGIPAQDTNTTYSEISTSEIDVGTSSTLRTITGRRVKYILDKVTEWLNNKVDKEVGKGLSSNDYTTDEKNKLAGIESGANNYTHPTGDGNLHVPATGTTNAGKVLTAGDTEGELSWSDPPANIDIVNNLTETVTGKALDATQGKTLNDKMGSLSSLTTTEQGSLVGAVNEVKGEVIAHLADGTQHAKVARFIIGTSTAGWTAKDCNYLCDGVDDQEEIIQALNDLPATGGEVVILDGTYNITASINIPKNNVSIRGSGNATTLKRMYNSTSANSGSTAKGLITLNGKSGCKIQGLQIDGNKATYTASYNYGIYLRSSSNNTITDNTCNNNSNGIYLSSSNNNTVTGNTCNNNSNGIYLYSSSNNTVIGNTCNNSNYGIYLFSSCRNTVTGNTCNNNSCSIYLSSSSNNTVTGNTCIRGTGQTSDYTSNQYTIRLQGTTSNYNLISSNNCMGKAPVVEGGTGNTVFNNKWDESSDFEDLRTDVDAHKAAAAPHSGHETPAGAQAKAEAAAGAVQAELDAHLAESASHVKPARIVIGTSTSGWAEKDCDYLCDGTNDQEEIIQALNALPATGGEIVILDGTYNITASINIPKDNVSIRGSGNATTLKRMYNSTNTDSGPTAKGLITLNGKSGCKIQGLQIDGNKATYTASYNYGIYLRSSSNNTITDNTCNNNDYGIYLRSSSDNTVTDNTCNNNSSYGIYLFSSSNNNTITDNTCNINGYGISLTSSSNNTVTSNTCNNNGYGIYLYSSSNNTVTGNTCNNNSCSIYLSSSSNNTVTGNTCIRGTGQTSDYTSNQYTIRLQGTANNYNLIVANNCMGKPVVVEGGTGNSAWGNKYDSGDDFPI